MKIYWSGDSKNIVGARVRALRVQNKLTQKALASKLQLTGHDFTDLTILRIENGTRFVPDYEVKALARVLGVSYSDLLDD
jgi:transcriptional regulator with XRE-family HTH domain